MVHTICIETAEELTQSPRYKATGKVEGLVTGLDAAACSSDTLLTEVAPEPAPPPQLLLNVPGQEAEYSLLVTPVLWPAVCGSCGLDLTPTEEGGRQRK